MFITKEINNKIQKRKKDIHQKSILRQMVNTCEKLGNSFLTKEETKIFQQRQRQQNLESLKSSRIQRQYYPQRFSHDPFKQTQSQFLDHSDYTKQSKQTKQIRVLRQKMVPKVTKTNIQRKLKELTYIRNMGYKNKNKKLAEFKTFSREQDEENIINKSWENFYQKRPTLTPTQTPVPEEMIKNREVKRKPTYFFLLKSQKEKKNEFDQNKETSPTLFSQTPSISRQLSFLEKSNVHKIQDLTLDVLNKQSKIKKISNKNKSNLNSTRKSFKKSNKNISIDNFCQNQTLKKKIYPLSIERKKQITEKIGLSKQKLQKENAFKLYKLITGGYNVDSNEAEGQHISLKRFKSAKDNFKMLNTCFNKIRQDRYTVQQPQKVFNDGSLRSLVYLTEIENKICQSTFRKIQQENNVVD